MSWSDFSVAGARWQFTESMTTNHLTFSNDAVVELFMRLQCNNVIHKALNSLEKALSPTFWSPLPLLQTWGGLTGKSTDFILIWASYMFSLGWCLGSAFGWWQNIFLLSWQANTGSQTLLCSAWRLPTGRGGGEAPARECPDPQRTLKSSLGMM